MIAPPLPADEQQRLGTLRALDILDTPPEERFDRYTRLARRLFDVPIAVVSLVDENRQWFKSRRGLDVTETPRSVSFCGHAILQREPLIVEDATRDERFADNPLVTGDPGIRFYAGAPLRAPDGAQIGTICIIDREPRELDEDDIIALGDLAETVAGEFAALEMATSDELTGISNRRGFRALAQKALDMCVRRCEPVSLVSIDLDGFKTINDTFGHQEGDRALQVFATMLLSNFRDSDVLGRIGGDEFCVLVTGAGVKAALLAIQRLETLVAEYNAASEHRYELRFSTGVTSFDTARHPTIEELFAQADSAMYKNKLAGRDAAAREEQNDTAGSALAEV